MNSALLIIDEIKKIYKNISNDIKRYRNITQEILKDLKKLTMGYTTLSYDFGSKNMLFDFITTAERIEVDYEMIMTKEFTIDSIKNISQKIFDYANSSEEKIKTIAKEIDKILGKI